MKSPKKNKVSLPASVKSDIDEEMSREEIIHYQMQGDLENDYDFMFAANLRQTMEEEEERDAKEHALEYKRECDALRNQLREQKKSHELEMTRLEAQYKAEIDQLRMERNKLAHESMAQQASPKPDEDEMKLGVTEVATHVKERFSKTGAEEVSTMLYHFAMEHDCLTKEIFNLIDGIVPAVILRDTPHQTFNMSNVQQFNNKPHQVINRVKEEDEKK